MNVGNAVVGRDAAIIALKAFAQRGLSRDASDEWIESYRAETDRGAVILVATLFEDRLAEILLSRMPNLNADERARLFGFDAPLGTFSAKIRMAQALGLLSRDLARVADMIREMRNACAHCRLEISFGNSEMANVVVAMMNATLALPLPQSGAQPKLFRDVFFMIVQYLRVYMEGGSKESAQEYVADLYYRNPLVKRWRETSSETPL